jgi:hypothetical protein
MRRILNHTCEDGFLDRRDLLPSTVLCLRGIAAALYEARGRCFRLSEAFELVRKLGMPVSKKMLSAGGAFAAGMLIPALVAGPRVLSFATAIDSFFDEPQTDFQLRISTLKEELEKTMVWDARLAEVFHAARERAAFDKTSQKLRTQFARGLRASQKYLDEEVEGIARTIVSTAAAVRHEALMLQVWQFGVKYEFPKDYDPFITAPEGSAGPSGYISVCGQDVLTRVAEAARIGCANALALELGVGILGSEGS